MSLRSNTGILQCSDISQELNHARLLSAVNTMSSRVLVLSAHIHTVHNDATSCFIKTYLDIQRIADMCMFCDLEFGVHRGWIMENFSFVTEQHFYQSRSTRLSSNISPARLDDRDLEHTRPMQVAEVKIDLDRTLQVKTCVTHCITSHSY